MKKIAISIFLAFFLITVKGQEAFTIKHYSVDIKVNKDASLDISETIDADFNYSKHGIIRDIPFTYRAQELPGGSPVAERQLLSNGYNRIIIEDVKVPGWDYKVSSSGGHKLIKIGSADKTIIGEQQFVINYRILNAINFFSDHSELYFNVIGDQWATTIDAVDLKIELPESLADTSSYFIATGHYGDQDKNAETKWLDNKTFTGHTTHMLDANEGVTVGIRFPQNYLTKTNYTFRGMGWLMIPVLVFMGMFMAWKKWWKDDKVTVQTEYYPPENVSPSVAGYVFDDKLNERDMTALVPYWGAGGYLRVNELQEKLILGIKKKDYEFIKIKDLPAAAPTFEKTLFNGIFKTGKNVKLSDLKDVLYTSMALAKSELQSEIKKDDYYTKSPATLGCLLPLAGFILIITGITKLASDWQLNLWLGIGLIISGIIVMVFGGTLRKKTPKGTLLYQQLLGFKEFIKSVEKNRLEEFLKQDSNYFDKVLPYAIVFNMANAWKDKLKGLEIPPPSWYSGYYSGGNFSTAGFMNNLSHSMNAMSTGFNSSPSSSSSGSSGGSFSSGGGGFSGGGFGGGGGSSW